MLADVELKSVKVIDEGKKPAVFVTGCAGFIGSHVCDYLIEKGIDVYGIDDLSSGKFENIPIGVDFVNYGLDNLAPGDFQGIEFDAVIHLAAQPSLLKSEEYPLRDLEVNGLGTINVLEFAKAHNTERFVFASTSAVFHDGNLGVISCAENDTRLTPNRPYGISKLAGEMYVRALSKSPYILRFANVYGPRQVPLGENQLIARALSHIYNDTPFEIYGDGYQTRDFIYVRDVARAVASAALEAPNHPYPINVSYGSSVSVKAMLDNVAFVTGWEGEWKKGEPKPSEPKHVSMSNTKARKILSWYPMYDIQKGLAKTAEWWKKEFATL